MTTLSLIILICLMLSLCYLLLLALAAVRPGDRLSVAGQEPTHRFIIAIPAHDEENVVAASVNRLQALDYPSEMFSIHLVADHCSDGTAEYAREAGATVHERSTGPRTGKGAALSWLFQRVLDGDGYDAVVVFDADTRVAPNFLRVMDARLAQGAQVVQGQHLISNPERGSYPRLLWAMFLVDNRFQNLGRTRLGWSAKNMGDSICFRAEILRRIGWGQGLTEDYQLRQRLLLSDINIVYEPTAIGRGEAPLTWTQARAQRSRWLQGSREASQQFARRLLVEGLRRRNSALIDGALQAYLPSYSTLTMFSLLFLLLQLAANWLVGPIFAWPVVGAWVAVVAILFVYPLGGLALERAPLQAYFGILSGPLFILWRSWLVLRLRSRKGTSVWVRTTHIGEQ